MRREAATEQKKSRDASGVVVPDRLHRSSDQRRVGPQRTVPEVTNGLTESRGDVIDTPPRDVPVMLAESPAALISLSVQPRGRR